MKRYMLRFNHYNNDLYSKKLEGKPISQKWISKMNSGTSTQWSSETHCSYCKGWHVRIPVHKMPMIYCWLKKTRNRGFSIEIIFVAKNICTCIKMSERTWTFFIGIHHNGKTKINEVFFSIILYFLHLLLIWVYIIF